MRIPKAPSWQSLFAAVAIINTFKFFFFGEPAWIIIPPVLLFLIVWSKKIADRMVDYGSQGR